MGAVHFCEQFQVVAESPGKELNVSWDKPVANSSRVPVVIAESLAEQFENGDDWLAAGGVFVDGKRGVGWSVVT